MTRADMESATPKRQSLRAASVTLPAELSASIGVGATLGAMMGAINLYARLEVRGMRAKRRQFGSANAVRSIFLFNRYDCP